jgi:hypothetical protein
MAETCFRHALQIERKRAERSGNPALLLLFDIEAGHRKNGDSNALAENVTAALLSVTRETDFTGWHSESRVLGAVFTQLPSTSQVQRSVAAITAKVEAALKSEVGERNIEVRMFSQLFSATEPQSHTKNSPLPTVVIRQ